MFSPHFRCVEIECRNRGCPSLFCFAFVSDLEVLESDFLTLTLIATEVVHIFSMSHPLQNKHQFNLRHGVIRQ